MSKRSSGQTQTKVLWQKERSLQEVAIHAAEAQFEVTYENLKALAGSVLDRPIGEMRLYKGWLVYALCEDIRLTLRSGALAYLHICGRCGGGERYEFQSPRTLGHFLLHTGTDDLCRYCLSIVSKGDS